MPYADPAYFYLQHQARADRRDVARGEAVMVLRARKENV